MEKTYKPTVAGILAIVAGAGGVITGFFLLVGVAAFNLFGRNGIHIPLGAPNSVMLVIAILAIPFFALAVLAVVGGAFALQRKNWGLALAGSIAALIISFVLGATSIVFTVLSKNEFK